MTELHWPEDLTLFEPRTREIYREEFIAEHLAEFDSDLRLASISSNLFRVSIASDMLPSNKKGSARIG